MSEESKELFRNETYTKFITLSEYQRTQIQTNLFSNTKSLYRINSGTPTVDNLLVLFN
jgi:hypothetical protein